MRRPVRVGDVGVVAVTWALFFPPARPRKVYEIQGDTPWNPRQRGQAPSELPQEGAAVFTPFSTSLADRFPVGVE